MIVVAQPARPERVAEHYDELDLAYRRIWGEHVHHGYWRTGRETPAEAALALTRLVGERLAPRRGDRLCDIGCGYGASAAWFAGALGCEVVGLTLSGAQAAVARNLGEPRFTCVQRDWMDNGLPDESFDGAYAIESSEHIADKAGFFAEAARVLRPGGRLVVCAWLAAEAPRRWEVRHLLEPICREGRMPSMGSASDYLALAESAGLRLLSHEDISRNVRRTWSICLRRLVAGVVTDREIRRVAFSSATRSRDFILSLPRLIVALRSGAMRYGVLVWDKP